MTSTASDKIAPGAPRGWWLEAVAILALALGIAARFGARPQAPLWLDEAATGAIVSQPTFSAFIRLAYWEVSSPLYFLLVRPWQAIFGLSDGALRAPSLIVGLATPLIIAFARIPHLARGERLSWAAMVALWIPGIGYAQDARCYALVLLLATLQTLAFIRVMRQPDMRGALAWFGLSSLTVAAHYDAVFLALAQGVIYLVVHRGAALRTWPAALVATPVLLVIAWQGPEIARYMSPDTTWYKVQRGWTLVGDGAYLFGSVLWVFLLPIVAAVFGVVGLRLPDRSPLAARSELIWASIASLSGAAVLLGLASVRPIFASRYLAPFEPGVSLGLLLCLGALAGRTKRVAYGCLVGIGALMVLLWAYFGAHHGDSVIDEFNYEVASDSLMTHGIRHLVFAWDNPNALAMHPEELVAFGDFFFRRAGRDVQVTTVRLAPTDDPNVVLSRAARRSDAAILWVYDTWVTRTAANRHPPRFAELAPGGHCHNFGQKNFGIIACVPAGGGR